MKRLVVLFVLFFLVKTFAMARGYGLSHIHRIYEIDDIKEEWEQVSEERWVKVPLKDPYYFTEDIYNLTRYDVLGVELLVVSNYEGLISRLLAQEAKVETKGKAKPIWDFSREQGPLIFQSRYYSNEKDQKYAVLGASEQKINGKYYSTPEAIVGRVFSLCYFKESNRGIVFEDRETESYYDLNLSDGTWAGLDADKLSDFINLVDLDELFYNYSYAKAKKWTYLTNVKNKKDRTYVCIRNSSGKSIDVETKERMVFIEGEEYYLDDMVIAETNRSKIELLAVLTSADKSIFYPFSEEFFDGGVNSDFKKLAEVESERDSLAAIEQRKVLIEQRKVLIEQRNILLRAKYGNNLANKILNKELSLDMTTEMCLEAWGQPSDKHRTVTKTKITEVWVYPHDRLTFENGKLISIEQTSLLRVNR